MRLCALSRHRLKQLLSNPVAILRARLVSHLHMTSKYDDFMGGMSFESREGNLSLDRPAEFDCLLIKGLRSVFVRVIRYGKPAIVCRSENDRSADGARDMAFAGWCMYFARHMPAPEGKNRFRGMLWSVPAISIMCIFFRPARWTSPIRWRTFRKKLSKRSSKKRNVYPYDLSAFLTNPRNRCETDSRGFRFLWLCLFTREHCMLLPP